MTNKEFDAACAVVLRCAPVHDRTLAESKDIRKQVEELVAEAIDLRVRLIESIGHDDVWDQADPLINYETYLDPDVDTQHYETSDSLIGWAKKQQ